MRWLLILIYIVLVSGLGVPQLFAMERHIMESRVPADKIDAAREMVSPLPDSPELVEKGKAIYEGKGTCFNCHGKSGRGDGPGGLSLNPSPRNFLHHGMWRHRTEGEIFWQKTIGGSQIDLANDVTVLNDDTIVVVGESNSNDKEIKENKGFSDLLIIQLNEIN